MSEKQMEKCVLCGKETEVEAKEHIGNRKFYVEGCGQLCCACHRKVFGVRIKPRSGV